MAATTAARENFIFPFLFETRTVASEGEERGEQERGSDHRPVELARNFRFETIRGFRT